MQAFRTRIRRVALTFIVILLCLFSLLLYLGLSTILHRHIDEELVALARQESQHVELAGGQIQLAPPGQRHAGKEGEKRNMMMKMRSPIVLNTKKRS